MSYIILEFLTNTVLRTNTNTNFTRANFSLRSIRNSHLSIDLLTKFRIHKMYLKMTLILIKCALELLAWHSSFAFFLRRDGLLAGWKWMVCCHCPYKMYIHISYKFSSLFSVYYIMHIPLVHRESVSVW